MEGDGGKWRERGRPEIRACMDDKRGVASADATPFSLFKIVLNEY